MLTQKDLKDLVECPDCHGNGSHTTPSKNWNRTVLCGWCRGRIFTDDAFMVVEKMRERKAHFVLASAPQKQTTVWFVDWTWAIGRQQNEVPDHDDSACLGSFTGNSIPRAICLAAIAALEER